MTLKRWKVVVDILLFVSFLSLSLTGLFPDQLVGRAGFHLLHVQVGKVFIVLTLVHLGLNWRWITLQIFRHK